jgi:hypothetical protein
LLKVDANNLHNLATLLTKLISDLHGCQMRFVSKILLMIVGLLVLAELFFVFRPEPDILTAGVALGEAPVTDVLRIRFPIGSPASALETELKREGYWGPIRIDRIGKTERFWHYVQFRRRVGLGLFTPEVTTIVWEVDQDGLLSNIYGSKYIDIAVP